MNFKSILMYSVKSMTQIFCSKVNFLFSFLLVNILWLSSLHTSNVQVFVSYAFFCLNISKNKKLPAVFCSPWAAGRLKNEINFIWRHQRKSGRVIWLIAFIENHVALSRWLYGPQPCFWDADYGTFFWPY